jgi:hypothetical protein
VPWDLQKLLDYKKLLEDIKALEDQVGCPCEPNKADHIKILKDRITELESKNNPKCKCKECQCNKAVNTYYSTFTNTVSVNATLNISANGMGNNITSKG